MRSKKRKFVQDFTYVGGVACCAFCVITLILKMIGLQLSILFPVTAIMLAVVCFATNGIMLYQDLNRK